MTKFALINTGSEDTSKSKIVVVIIQIEVIIKVIFLNSTTLKGWTYLNGIKVKTQNKITKIKLVNSEDSRI